MKRRAVIEDAIGETRAAIYEGRRLVELHSRRTYDTTPRPGDRYAAKVITVDASVAGMFVDMGPDAKPALLPFGAQRDLPRLSEGEALTVEVIRAEMTDKGASVRYFGEGTEAKPGCIKRLNLREAMARRFEDIKFDEAAVSAIDDVVERTIALNGGGSVTFDQTQALLAIDVDKGAAESPAAAAQEAAETIAKQLRLRGLGGLVVIDFPNLRQPKHRTRLQKTFEEVFETDPMIAKFAPLSRFGCLEMTRSKPEPSLDDMQTDRFGEMTPETLALRALRRLTREAKTSPGAKLTLFVTPDVMSWLEAAPFDWRKDVTDRIGARFEVVTGDTIDVKADR